MTNQIFVGNIPYNFNKSDLEKKLSLVGPVKSFNIINDQKTNSKGFGFCEYCDDEVALSALRNLKNIDYNGRQLRIGIPANVKTEVLSEEENLIKKDITYLRENIENKNENNQNNNPKNNNSNKYKFQNILLGLSDPQKILLLYSMKTIESKDGKNFYKLLENQNLETLDAIMAIQNDFIGKFNKNK